MSFVNAGVAIGGALLSGRGSKESSQGYAEGWTNDKTDASKDSTIINSLLESLRSNQTVRKGGEFSRNAGANFITELPEYIKQFSKENAIADSSSAVTAALTEVLATNLPDVRTGDTIAGGYNNTSTRLLQDNVFSQAAAAGAKVRMDAIDKYAGVQAGAQNVLTQMISLAQDADVIVDDDQDSTSNSTQKALEYASSYYDHKYGETTKGSAQGRGGADTARGISTGFEIFNSLNAAQA